jgi:hypothetical protein
VTPGRGSEPAEHPSVEGCLPLSPQRFDGSLWPAVDALLAQASPEDAQLHGLGPMQALRLRRIGEPLPQILELEARMATFAMLSVRPLLDRVRSICDGKLVLMKGPEIAIRYPGSARAFMDIDLLVAHAERTHRQLRDAGFAEVEDENEPFRRHHHLRPLKWPDLPLPVEIHDRPHWPEGLDAPETASILGSAVSSALGVEGIDTPEPAQHALLVAAHAWAHEPLHLLRDLVDARALISTGADSEIARTARAWGIGRLWRTTDRVTDAVLSGRRLPALVELWAGHLPALRERTVLENHLRAWLSAYWALPLRSAAASTARAAWSDIAPAPEEGWRDKLARAVAATRNATAPLSHHDRRLGDAATRGRKRDRPPSEERGPS